MRILQLGSAQTCMATSARVPTVTRYQKAAILAAITFLAAISSSAGGPLRAATPPASQPDPTQANTSAAARKSAVQSIPFDRLDADSQAKVRSVLSSVSVFRRMPIRVVDCDPNLYLFLVRHPDVVVNIWEVLKLSSVKLRETSPDTYRVAEAVGTLANVKFLYRSHDTHVLYAEGKYDGPLFARTVKGRALIVLKSGYVRETNGRYYVTTRLDTFVRIDHGGAELLTKTFQPLMGKTADANFIQTMAFLGSLSRTAEVNSRGVQRLASKLTHIRPEHRDRLAKLAATIAQKSATASVAKPSNPVRIAGTETSPGS